MDIDDSETPYATFFMPFPADNVYLSDWPDQLCQRAYRFEMFLTFHFSILLISVFEYLYCIF